MSSNDNSGAILLAAVVIGIPLLLVLSLSRSIGADFQTTLHSVMYSGLFLIFAGVAVWMGLRLFVAVSCFSVFTWPCWWKVLDSIANGGHDQTDFPFPTDVWYTSSWFEYGIEAALICLAGYVISQGLQRY